LLISPTTRKKKDSFGAPDPKILMLILREGKDHLCRIFLGSEESAVFAVFIKTQLLGIPSHPKAVAAIAEKGDDSPADRFILRHIGSCFTVFVHMYPSVLSAEKDTALVVLFHNEHDVIEDIRFQWDSFKVTVFEPVEVAVTCPGPDPAF